MKKKNPPAWTHRDSEHLYGLARWGGGHFQADAQGYLGVEPLADGRRIRIMDVVKEALSKGLQAPLVVRFQDLLRHRVVQLNEAFRKAIAEESYEGTYRGVFPVKVNQLREVVEEILDAGEEYGYGLEAGSKPELIIALAMHDSSERLIICNGYKDEQYIRLALLGTRLGKKIILVAEQLTEIDTILRLAAETGIQPWIGLRAKLNTRGEGKWALSTGDNAKFGLTSLEILRACQKIRQAGMEEQLRLLHFHIGSQVPNILTIKNAVVEASRFYVQLAQMGFPMGFLDVGGGLGIDYDGSRTNYESSMNYSLEEYTRDVVSNVREVCRSSGVKEPDLITESGRAVAAPHSMLVVEVFEHISKLGAGRPELSAGNTVHRIVDDLRLLHDSARKYGRLERFHDALQRKEEAYNLFNLGYLDLENRALAEYWFWKICHQIDQENTQANYIPEELSELKKLLADQYVCNFSVFQSLLDHWALRQLFPIVPLHRLNESPSVNATLVDITCDSDGKVSQFIDLEDIKDYLPLHPLNKKPYYLGIFLVGAYQDIMGDLHNLFGRVNEVHVFLDEEEDEGYYIEETIEGNQIREVLEGVQYKASDLYRQMKRQIDRATKRNLVKAREGTQWLEFYSRVLSGKTYLDIGRAPVRRKTPGKKLPPKETST